MWCAQEAPPRTKAIERERLPSGATDWNDALRALPERVEGHGQGQEDDRVPGRGRGYGGRDEPGRDEGRVGAVAAQERQRDGTHVDWINEQLTLLGSVVPATKLDKCMSHFEKRCLCI